VQVNLLPVKQDDKALAIATILTQGNSSAMALVGQDLPPTTSKEFYVVWLYNSPADAVFLGYTSPVGKNGRLSGTTRLPAKAANYGQLVVSREGAKRPKRPTKIVLKGSFKLS